MYLKTEFLKMKRALMRMVKEHLLQIKIGTWRREIGTYQILIAELLRCENGRLWEREMSFIIRGKNVVTYHKKGVRVKIKIALVRVKGGTFPMLSRASTYTRAQYGYMYARASARSRDFSNSIFLRHSCFWVTVAVKSQSQCYPVYLDLAHLHLDVFGNFQDHVRGKLGVFFNETIWTSQIIF